MFLVKYTHATHAVVSYYGTDEHGVNGVEYPREFAYVFKTRGRAENCCKRLLDGHIWAANATPYPLSAVGKYEVEEI
jgi:hypothetical protein